MSVTVTINYIFSLIWRRYGPKWDIWNIEEQSYFVYYPIISYRRIRVYKLETMDMGISHWKNIYSGMDLVSIITMVIIVQDKILW